MAAAGVGRNLQELVHSFFQNPEDFSVRGKDRILVFASVCTMIGNQCPQLLQRIDKQAQLQISCVSHALFEIKGQRLKGVVRYNSVDFSKTRKVIQMLPWGISEVDFFGKFSKCVYGIFSFPQEAFRLQEVDKEALRKILKARRFAHHHLIKICRKLEQPQAQAAEEEQTQEEKLELTQHLLTSGIFFIRDGENEEKIVSPRHLLDAWVGLQPEQREPLRQAIYGKTCIQLPERTKDIVDIDGISPEASFSVFFQEVILKNIRAYLGLDELSEQTEERLKQWAQDIYVCPDIMYFFVIVKSFVV